MDIKIGQKVFVEEGTGLKNLYGYVMNKENVESMCSSVLLQLVSWEQEEIMSKPHNRNDRYKNNRYWWVDSKEITCILSDTPFPVGCRVFSVLEAKKGTVVVVINEFRRLIYFDDGEVAEQHIDWLGLADESLKDAQKLSDAAVRYFNYKTQSEIKPAKRKNVMEELQGVTIKVIGNKVIALDKDGNKGVAKCCPEDEFNLETGVSIACMRLMQLQRFNPYLIDNTNGLFKGYIGEPTDLKDDLGEPLRVGDIVKAKA